MKFEISTKKKNKDYIKKKRKEKENVSDFGEGTRKTERKDRGNTQKIKNNQDGIELNRRERENTKTKNESRDVDERKENANKEKKTKKKTDNTIGKIDEGEVEVGKNKNEGKLEKISKSDARENMKKRGR